MKAKLKAAFRTGAGATYNIGHEFTLSYDIEKARHSIVGTDANGNRMVVRATRAHLYFNGFKKEPSIQTLTKWEEGEGAKSVRGKRADPDGCDEDNFPSWLVVLDLI